MKKPQGLKPEAYTNPYNNYTRNTLRKIRYNVQPELDENRLAQATYQRALREASPSASSLHGGMQVGSLNTMRANAGVLARKQNVDAQYLADQAQMDYNLGNNLAQTKLTIQDINDRNAAARRNYTATGLGQLGQYSQTKQLMNNQMVRDAQRLNLLPALVQNFTLTKDGKWIFKETGQEMTPEQVMSFVKGNNI
jgi:hypothetical protein